MFPRVLGSWVGRAAGYVAEAVQDLRQSFQRLINNNETVLYRQAARDALIVAFVPYAGIPVTMHWMFRAAAQLSHIGQNQNNPPLPMDHGVGCYLQAVAESDPLLISPVGTMRIQECLLR